jgi:hypothetical protein
MPSRPIPSPSEPARWPGVWRVWLIGLWLPVVVACSPAAPQTARSDNRPHAPVVVTIVVDQLAAWVASERWNELPPTGGFARLVREGTWVRAMRYEHAVTDTAPGHSSLYTGAVPHVSGIFANEVIHDGETKALSILVDPSARVITSDGEVDRPGSSLRPLLVETLADRLRAEHPDAFIASVSLKDRGALFGGGRAPSAALWLDTKLNRFVTSTAVLRAMPAWAKAASSALVLRAESRTWELLDAPWVASHASTPDAEVGEGEVPGFGTVFPHRLTAATTPSLAFRTSPFADEALVALGLLALDVNRDPHRTTLLALSLSSNDYIGHTFGPDSWEAWDELLRLDGVLRDLLAGLDTRFGADGYSVLLTGDHGTTAMPEVGRARRCDSGQPDPWDRACEPADRVMGEELSGVLAARARESLGPGDWVAGVSDPYVYLTLAARALDAPRKARLYETMQAVLRSWPHVARVFVVGELPSACPAFSDESIDALVCRSVAPGAGDFYVVLTHGSFFDPNVIVGKGTSHGSPYLYDRTVPLLVRAPGRVQAGLISASLPYTAFVRTAADLLAIAPPRDAGPGVSLARPLTPR